MKRKLLTPTPTAVQTTNDDEDNFDFREDEDVELMEVHMTERAKVEKFL